MIIEGLMTTRNADGSVHVAPLGPIVTGDFERLTLRPFPTSVTYGNLQRNRCGVFHVVDDVLLLAQTALGLEHAPPAVRPARQIAGDVLIDCCRWYEFVVESIDESGERPRFESRVVETGRVRDSLGFNRARHAVIEAAIFASRIRLTGGEVVLVELERLRSPVEKTGGPRELEAFRLIEQYVRASSNFGEREGD